MKLNALSGLIEAVTYQSELSWLCTPFLTGLWASLLKQKAVVRLTEVLEGV